MSSAHIGIVEDDADVRRLLGEALRTAGHRVTAARNGREAVELMRSPGSVDALILDIGLPDADGRDVLQALRAAGQQAPALFLTAYDAVPERIAGLRAGADDYVVKPFAIGELLARVDVLLRHAQAAAPAPADLLLDPTSFAVRGSAGEQRLTPTEFRLLAVLAAQPGTVVRRAALVAAGWPDGAIVTDNTLDSFVRRVRSKLAQADAEKQVETVRGVGYVLR